MTLLNHWFSSYEEARQFLDENPDHYLIPYKKQFVVVDDNYLKTIGVWEGCADCWQAIGHDAHEGYGSHEWHELVWKRIENPRKRVFS